MKRLSTKQKEYLKSLHQLHRYTKSREWKLCGYDAYNWRNTGGAIDYTSPRYSKWHSLGIMSPQDERFIKRILEEREYNEFNDRKRLITISVMTKPLYMVGKNALNSFTQEEREALVLIPKERK